MDGGGSFVPATATVSTPDAAALDLSAKPLDLRELRCFLSVARAGNFGRAAREMKVGQPAITYQMQKLEAGLGTQLLVRHGRGVTLTRAGTRLRDRLEQVMRLLASPLEDGAEAALPDRGTVALALPAELGPLLAAPLVERFRALWPSTRLEIQEGSGALLEEWLLDRRVDLAIIQDPTGNPELAVSPVLTETLGLVVSARSILADESGPLRLRDVAMLPLILPGPAHWIRRRLDHAAFQAGITLDAAWQVDSVPLTTSMVRSGLGCTVLCATAVQEELARGVMGFRPIIGSSLSAVHAIVHRHASRSPAVLDLARQLHTAMVALVEIGGWTGARVIGSKRDCWTGTFADAAGDCMA